MALPTVRAAGAVVTNTAASIAPVNPTHAAGDLLLCFASSTNIASGTPTVSLAGWTQIGSIVNNAGAIRGVIGAWALRASSGAEANPSINCTPTGSTATHHAASVVSIQAGSWNDTGTLSDAWEDVTTGLANAGSAAAVNLTGLVTTGADRLCVAGIFQSDNVATGLTDNGSYSALGVDSDSATGTDGFYALRQKNQAAAGAAGATFTFTSGGTSAGCVGIAFAIRPAQQLTGETLVTGAQVTCSGGPVTIQATGVPLNASGATATASTGGTSLSASVPVTGATAAGTTGSILVTAAGGTEPIVGTVTYPTSTTWECEITNLTYPTYFDVASSDAQSASVYVELTAGPHTVRIEAGGTPVTATLNPGADASGATATGSTGSVSREASRPVTGAQATGATGSVSRTASVPVTGATASATTGGTVVLSSTQTHRIRIEAGGTPLEFDLVPGQDASGAAATGTGAIALAAERPVTGAQATGATGSVRIVEHLMVSGAQATGATGSVALAGSRAVTGATATGRTGSVRIEASVGPPLVPWLPYNAGLGTLPRAWWKRRGRAW